MRAMGGVLVVMLGSGVLTGAERAAVVPLAWRPIAPLPAGVVAGAQEEIAAVFRRAGVSVTWAADDGALAAGTLPVVVLESGRSATLPPRLLGASSLDRAAGVWIFYSAIRTQLGLRQRAARRPTAREARLLGRALGRVIAHEIVHAYQPAHEHAADGLMRRQLDARQLTSDALEWDLATQATFVRALIEGPRGVAREAGATQVSP